LRSSPPQRSTLPPGLVEPKRIIEVLGSNVPVLDHQIEEEIEDLDDSEAHELAESQEQDGASSQSDFDLDVDFDAPQQEAEPGPVSEPGSLVDADQILDISSQPPTRAGATTDSGAARGKIPPKKRKRPTPPSTRSGEHKLDAAALEKAAQEKAEKAAQEKAAADRRSDAPPAPHGRKWWEEMFSEEFLRAIPILSPRQLEREVNCIEESLGVAPGGQILDLACGAGQHAVELAARGYDLVGFDLSQSQLDWASGLALERNQRLQFTNGDMRELSYQESFDAIYSWNTSFGFFEEDKNFDAAQRIFKALRPGGRFLLDVINRDFVVAQQPGQTWFEGDGCVCIDDVTIDFITSRMRVKRTLMLTNGKNRECTYSVRIYSLHELGKLLHDVGFKILKVSGRPEMPGVFFGSTSPRVIILAGKP
jgi:SAM-dependent methyltransferase